MIALDGIENKINSGQPLDKNIYALIPKEYSKNKSVPGSLGELLDALESDSKFLLKGDVFTPGIISFYIEYQRENELAPMAFRPHPFKFELYYDN